jgi:hypothetical protein
VRKVGKVRSKTFDEELLTWRCRNIYGDNVADEVVVPQSLV